MNAELFKVHEYLDKHEWVLVSSKDSCLDWVFDGQKRQSRLRYCFFECKSCGGKKEVIHTL